MNLFEIYSVSKKEENYTKLTKKNDIRLNIRFFVKPFFLVFFKIISGTVLDITKTKQSMDSVLKKASKSCEMLYVRGVKKRNVCVKYNKLCIYPLSCSTLER